MTCEPWPVVWSCSIDTEDPDKVESAREAAQEILFGLSGRRFGLCTVTESYRANCSSACGMPYKTSDGFWRNGISDAHTCCHILLSRKPVRAIMSVSVFGDVLDAGDYALERDYLWRSQSCWPCVDDCDDPAVEVTYSYGLDVPMLGQLAVGEVACEILAGLSGADCRLPSNAVSVSRQGVTVELGDAQTLFDQGRIGLPMADAFLRAVNPGKLMSQSQVFSPDMTRRAR